MAMSDFVVGRYNAIAAAADLKTQMIEEARHLSVQYGLSTRVIGRIIGVSNVTVGRWLK
jgi:transposase-like protein